MSWLDKLKPGDRVIVSDGHRGAYVDRVDRITKTQIITKNGRWRKLDGHPVGGGSWSLSMIREDTPEAVEKANRTAQARYLSLVSWRTMPDDVLSVCAKLVRDAMRREGK